MVSRKKKILSAGLLVCLSLCLALWLLVAQNRNSLSFKDRGDDAFARHAYGKAITAWKAALENHPDDPAVYKKLKTVYLRLGMVSRARKVLVSAVALFPDDHDLAMELARLELLKGEIAAAEKRCDRLKAINPGQSLFLLYRGQAGPEKPGVCQGGNPAETGHGLQLDTGIDLCHPCQALPRLWKGQ